MKKVRISAILLLIFGFAVLGFDYYSQVPGQGFISNFPFKLGLDLSGGSHLVYQADLQKSGSVGGVKDVDGAMESLRGVIESRINAFGVSEPIIQTEKSTINGQEVRKLVVELPGVTDLKSAIDTIGKTPVLEFKIQKEGVGEADLTKATELQKALNELSTSSSASAVASANAVDATSSLISLLTSTSTNNQTAKATSTVAATVDYSKLYDDVGLTGQYLKSAQVQFDTNTRQPLVAISFDETGKAKFAEVTGKNIGKILAIFLDGKPISTPVIRDQIKDGSAVISGNFTPEEAKSLARDLRYGALPVPITLIGTQSIGASLGENALKASVDAGLWGFLIIAIFLLLWYRLPGLVAIVSLSMYTIFMLAIFKMIPVVLTSAGLAAFILSIGMAVDGNILIFERMREELAKGHSLEDGIREGFARAWLSIRDSNLSSIITAVILYFFATSALIKGFALVFLIGVLVSMFTAITISRTFLLALGVKKHKGIVKFLFSNGLRR
ncbi:MAG: protein translocase subunit SecD [bacterium]